MQDLALPHHFCCRAPSDSHPTPSWTFALLGAKWLSENLPSRRFILPRRRVVKVTLCPLPYGHSFARKAWERTLRDERHEGLGLFSTGLRSPNVGFISPNCPKFEQPVSASHHLPQGRDEHLQGGEPRPVQGVTRGWYRSLHRHGGINLKPEGTNPTLSGGIFP